jgi:hypothetical protein
LKLISFCFYLFGSLVNFVRFCDIKNFILLNYIVINDIESDKKTNNVVVEKRKKKRERNAAGWKAEESFVRHPG